MFLGEFVDAGGVAENAPLGLAEIFKIDLVGGNLRKVDLFSFGEIGLEFFEIDFLEVGEFFVREVF